MSLNKPGALDGTGTLGNVEDAEPMTAVSHIDKTSTRIRVEVLSM